MVRFKNYLLRFSHKKQCLFTIFISVMCQQNDLKSKVNVN